MGVLEEVKQRFPKLQVTIHNWNEFANIIIIRYEKGNKYRNDGFPNPDWFWREWGLKINTDEAKIDKEALSESLDKIELEYEGVTK